MTFFEAIVIGIVEGITEFLPISSTGHIILTSNLLGVSLSEFTSSFTIAIQLGAILAVAILYGQRFFQSRRTLLLIGAAFVPTAIIGVSVYPLVKELLEEVAVVGWSLIIGGIVILLFEWWYEEQDTDTKSIETISFKQALAVGLWQAFAMIPGVSRSGATIVGGMLGRLSRKTIVEFSFLLAIPTMAAATFYDLWQTGGDFTAGEWQLLVVGFVTSCIVSMLAIKWLVTFIQTYSFAAFGWYRIVVGILVLWFLV